MTDFGDRMKLYEGLTDIQLMPLTPICTRLDGRAFHNLTKNMVRPFDDSFRNGMSLTAQKLLEETNARIAYTQSDEISLVFLQDDFKSEIFFGGRLQKMCSILASMTTLYFSNYLRPAMFDCRIWSVPNIDEACNYLVWREQDAVRNSIQMAARSVFSHKECFKKDCSELQEMLFQKGINWNDYPDCHKRGLFFRRVVNKRKFTAEEIDKLPPKHEARLNLNLEIERTDTIALHDLPILTKMEHSERVFKLFL